MGVFVAAVEPKPCCVLGQFSFAEKWEHPQDTEVLGALDLGGASTQITFQPGVALEDRNTSVFFRLYGTNYSLYSQSYLCYGQSQALKMLLAALHQVLGAQGLLSHVPLLPHLPAGLPVPVGKHWGIGTGLDFIRGSKTFPRLGGRCWWLPARAPLSPHLGHAEALFVISQGQLCLWVFAVPVLLAWLHWCPERFPSPVAARLPRDRARAPCWGSQGCSGSSSWDAPSPAGLWLLLFGMALGKGGSGTAASWTALCLCRPTRVPRSPIPATPRATRRTSPWPSSTTAPACVPRAQPGLALS